MTKRATPSIICRALREAAVEAKIDPRIKIQFSSTNGTGANRYMKKGDMVMILPSALAMSHEESGAMFATLSAIVREKLSNYSGEYDTHVIEIEGY